ncbi:phospholipase A2 isozymes PA3A/PA3B/PA5-like [Palaemon carinicauda]|uniref:phospholipase A2 isozymes PA3A/PA3B/PA5-like n=1 Tax=Palaemon carinicauda TaxID=392227 RepID=UPI0035B5F950
MYFGRPVLITYQKWEQEKALQYLSEIMPLRPIDFDSMVHLITLCGTLNIPPPPPGTSYQEGSNPLWWLDFSTIQGILPGTKWCGVRDRATYYRELGPKQKVDNCCRAHDHCPIKVSGLTTRYGVTNLGLNTLSHCTCDLEFYRCLKAANTDVSAMVGQVYFNYLDVKCLDATNKTRNGKGTSNRPQRGADYGKLECVLWDQNRECRKWELFPEDFSVQLAISRLGLSF